VALGGGRIVTVWAFHRVEPVSRQGDPGMALAAVVADPLWMLARQRQYGELAGEDAGSPIRVDFRVVSHPIDGWSADGETVLPYDPASQVLEAVVAGESAGPAHSLRDRIDAGRRIAAAVSAGVNDALRAAFPLDASATSDLLFQAAPARFCDGLAAALAVTNAAGGTEATTLGLSDAQWTAAASELQDIAVWAVTTFGMGPSTWEARRLERRFGLASGGELVLDAPEHTSETVDVPDLDLTEAGAALAATDATPLTRRIPTPIRFPGMPDDRYWAFEDARLSLARIDAATNDLSRLALVDFSTVYGNDWFVFPTPVTAGTIASVDDLIVVDTFGVQQLIQPADLSNWAMFTPSGPGTDRARLVLPATTASPLTGPVVEEVVFVRDENANLVWGLEKVVTDAVGDTHDLVAEYAAGVGAGSPWTEGAELLYRLMTDVPEHWVPFVPVHDEGSLRDVVLVEAVLPRPNTLGALEIVEPLSSVLKELRGTHVHEEEVPPEGVIVRRRWFLARSADGGRHTWAARSVQTGRGEGSSGLEFDIAIEAGGVQ
jgi:hypothetical protein